MSDWAVITGAGSGIGRCLAMELCRRAIPVIGVGRRSAALDETDRLIRSAGAGGFTPVAADLGTARGRQIVSDTVGTNRRIRILAHLAGTFPIRRFENVTADGLHEAIATNVEGRLFLTQNLLERMRSGSRILFVKSGSSEKPRVGCIQVCVSMAASAMLQRCLKLELSPRGILVSSTKPGFVQTEMMDTTLKATAEVFPDVTAIRSSPMIRAETCAQYLTWLLVDTADSEYAKDDWNIEDRSHHPKWLQGRSLHIANGAHS